MAEKPKIFPENFFWGASTSSYQVEGGNHNQWTVWELAHAAELSSTAHQRYSHLKNWPEIQKRAESPSNYVSGKGVGHYDQYKTDFAIAKKLNLNALRFGIEWSRLEPEPGQWDDEAWKHYKVYVRELKKQGLEPFLNLWHWTGPVWFEELGGFKNARNLKYFKRFVAKAAEELGKDVQHVLTINEPNVFAGKGYFDGTWPPGEKSWWSFVRVYHNLARAHRLAYKAFKKVNPSVQIGPATQLGNIQAKSKRNVVDRVMVKWMRYFWNWWWLNRVKRHMDFVGFNYYFTDYYHGFKPHNPSSPTNDMGWYMEPEGLYPLLIRVNNHYKKPVVITENGVADGQDRYRRWWIEQTIVAMERAISEGVDLRGYLHWSLLDNFEWADGWWPKFGLVEVKRPSLERKVRASAKWYAAKIKDLS